jgi:hypothetical protein
MTILKVKSGYDKKTIARYRNPASIAEMVSYCDQHSHIDVLDDRGQQRRVKVNGKVRTWKRYPSRVEVPFKYGLYEYGIFSASEIERILIPID